MKKQANGMLIFLLAGLMSFGQYDSSRSKHSVIDIKEQYNRQSRSWMKKSAILAGSGIVLIVIGAVTFPKDYDSFFFINSSKTESQAEISGAFLTVGTGLFISSIPCLITGFVKKHRANVLLRTERLSVSPRLTTSEWQLKTGIAIHF